MNIADQPPDPRQQEMVMTLPSPGKVTYLGVDAHRRAKISANLRENAKDMLQFPSTTRVKPFVTIGTEYGM